MQQAKSRLAQATADERARKASRTSSEKQAKLLKVAKFDKTLQARSSRERRTKKDAGNHTPGKNKVKRLARRADRSAHELARKAKRLGRRKRRQAVHKLESAESKADGAIREQARQALRALEERAATANHPSVLTQVSSSEGEGEGGMESQTASVTALADSLERTASEMGSEMDDGGSDDLDSLTSQLDKAQQDLDEAVKATPTSRDVSDAVSSMKTKVKTKKAAKVAKKAVAAVHGSRVAIKRVQQTMKTKALDKRSALLSPLKAREIDLAAEVTAAKERLKASMWLRKIEAKTLKQDGQPAGTKKLLRHRIRKLRSHYKARLEAQRKLSTRKLRRSQDKAAAAEKLLQKVQQRDHAAMVEIKGRLNDAKKRKDDRAKELHRQLLAQQKLQEKAVEKEHQKAKVLVEAQKKKDAAALKHLKATWRAHKQTLKAKYELSSKLSSKQGKL